MECANLPTVPENQDYLLISIQIPDRMLKILDNTDRDATLVLLNFDVESV